MEKIKRLRAQIDDIDKSIIELLAKRMDVVGKIGNLKQKKEIPPLDEKRWEEVLEGQLKRAEELGLNKNEIKKIYTIIHNYALAIQGK